MIATQSSPIIVAQLMVWNMLKETADWPPESITHMKQMADAAHYCMAKMSPMCEVLEFVPDDSEEEEEEGI